MTFIDVITHTAHTVAYTNSALVKGLRVFSHDAANARGMAFPMVSAATIYLYVHLTPVQMGIDLYYRSVSFIRNSCGEIMFRIIS